MAPTAKLIEAIRDSGVRSTNFFNSRLLTGEDMRSEQQANRAARMLLGRAIGPGIAEGLYTTAQGSDLVLHITAGVAINRLGHVLTLATEQTLALTEPPATTANGTAGFAICGSNNGSYAASNGLYVLTIAPAEYSEGRALVSGLASATAACNIKQIIETAQFRLFPLVLNLNGIATAQIRNQVAYAMFAAQSWAELLANPFTAPAAQLPAPQGITDCDVPLAVIQIKENKLVFVDAWAARRSCAPLGSGSRWETLFGDLAEQRTEAMFYQFQTHLDDIALGERATTKATDRFRYLPPVGLVPTSFGHFFDTLPLASSVSITPNSVGPLVQHGLQAQPINLANSEAIWRFQVGSIGGAFTYDVFVSGYAIDLLARYNQSFLNRATFAAANDTLPIV